MKQILFIPLLLALLAGGVCHAQGTAEQLTNAKVISMVKGGLPKAAIVKTIEGKAGNFDTSTDALIALKKAGVPDDVITAIVSKASPSEPVRAVAPVAKVEAPKFAPFKPTPPVDAKECKIVTAKTADGTKLSLVQASAKMGNFLMGREHGKITLVYDTKMLLALIMQDTHNRANLKIDSVQFLFVDNSVITIKPVGSYGSLPNKTVELKPQLETLHLVFALEPGSKEEHQFTTTKLKLFRALAEKDGKYADALNDKQQDKFLQAFNCIPEQVTQ